MWLSLSGFCLPAAPKRGRGPAPAPPPQHPSKLTRFLNYRMETLFWVLGDRRGPNNLSKAEKLGPGPVVGMPNPTEDVAGTWKGGICPSHPYFVPWVALETKGCVDG